MIKELRAKTGMTQKKFAERYHIPLQTLKQWEVPESSKSHRAPPAYVCHMLERLVHADLPEIYKQLGVMYLIRAAEHSRYNAQHWYRYLRKEVPGGVPRLRPEQIKVVANSDSLTMFQKVVFSRAMVEGSPTNRYLAELNQPAKLKMMEELKRRHGEKIRYSQS